MIRQARWALILVSLVLVIVLIVWMNFQGFHAKPIAFDQKQWMLGRDQIKQNNDPGCVLGGMALHLQQNSQLAQMPQQELFILLGSPDSAGDKAFLWELGQCNGGGWKHSQLKISLDKNGRVKVVDFQESIF